MNNSVIDIKNSFLNRVLDKSDISKLIPQREPFLMIDKVIKIDIDNEEIICEKSISIENDTYLKGHFPNNPVVPGVIMIEMMAQASCVIGKFLCLDNDDTFLLVGVNDCKFSGIATVGDKLSIRAKSIKRKGKLFISDCSISKNANVIAKCQITAFLKQLS